MDGVKRIKINFKPQGYQKESLFHPARFKVIIRGRRGGKTEEEIQGAIKDAVTNPGLHWITAPSYRQVKSIIWTRLKAVLRIDDLWKFNEQELYAEHPAILDENKVPTRLELKGCDKTDSLVGVGLKSLRMDEAGLTSNKAWDLLRPMLADHKAPAWFYTTPRGKNWLYDLYKRGKSLDYPDWMSWRQPTSVNKYISPDEIDLAKQEMSELMFRQEFMAEFLEDDIGVFRRIRACVTGEFESPIPGRFYVIGVDLAKSYDFTVLTVIDSVTRQVVAWERFQDVSWKEQKLRIQALAIKYNNALCVIDSTGVGDPIYEDLSGSSVSCESFKFTNATKNKLVDQLAISIEQRLITFPRIPELIQELSQFEYKISDGGRIIYSAPDGKHDDCVISLGLAVWALRSSLKEAQVVQEQTIALVEDKVGRGEVVWDEEEDEQEYGGY